MVWDNCLENLKGKLSEEMWKQHISGLRLLEVNDIKAVVEAPPNADLKMLSRNLKGLVEMAYMEVSGGSNPEFEFRHPPQHNTTRAGFNKGPHFATSNLQDTFTFESFVVGGKSQFAYSAAFAVAESPGKTQFNPLLIYGGSGLGKTHLLQAVGNYALDENPQTKVHYITAEDFTREFINAIKERHITEFSNYYRNEVDVLLIDDIQFLDRKIETQNEFFHIFNTLYQGGKQIVLTSDNPPSEVKGLEDRLISRFQWGLSVDVQPPDVETREAILRKKADMAHLDLGDEIITYLAVNIEGNVRQLEGAVSKLLLLTSVEKSDISMNLARMVVEEIAPSFKRQVNKDAIISTVSEFFAIPEDKLLESGRGTKEVAHARQVAMYLMKKLTNLSHKSVGKRFGDRDHSTVVHAINTIETFMKEDHGFAKALEQLRNKLQS
jgi:chromosomal replication initiator protein